MNPHNIFMGSTNHDFSVGELIIFGFKGHTVSHSTQNTIQKYGITQFILFGPNNPNNNYESKSQLIELTRQLQGIHANPKHPMIVSADQEGGKVQRFRKDFTLLPSAKKVADKNSTQLAFALSEIQAKELFAAGIQLNFAPVCDINTNPKNPVIGDRAYGDNEAQVSKFISEIVRGHASQNVETCMKHFPGHGDTHVDSHFDLPSVDTDLSTLRTREWVPFQKGIQAGCRFLMSAHVLLPQLDPHFPGTFSKTFMQKHLRAELNYQGVVVSDDMEMHAVTKNFGENEAPILALEAGCDLLCYRTEAAAITALESIQKAIIDQRLPIEKIKQSIDRIRAVRKNIKLAQSQMSINDRLAVIGNPTHLAFVQQFE